MTRVIHTGDTHIGYRQYHSPERRADFLAAFRRVIDDAIEEEVDAVVHAGDLFHDRRPALHDVHGTVEILRELRDAGIPFLAVVGNHERTRDEQWLDLFETLGLATRLGRDPTPVGGVAFYGLDYVPRSKRDDLAYDFEPAGAEHAALVSHGLFTPFNTDWDIRSVLEDSPVAFDAVLLGDDHHPDTAQVGDAWVTYCGSTERTSAAERDERGYNIVEFDGEVSIRRRGLETREFVTIDLDLAPGEGADRVRERIREEAVRDAVVVVSIEGDGDEVSAARIEEFARDRGALIARVNDRREVEATETEAVQFTDPDEAVRERLREMGLSEAAREVDATVRNDTVADSNVRDRVRESVEDLLEGDDGAFEPAPEPDADGTASGEDAGTGDGGPGDGGTAEAAGDGATGDAVDAAEDAGTEEDDGAADRAEDVGAGAAERDETDGADGGSRTTTMEDFL